jgi:sucrose phosphorylase
MELKTLSKTTHFFNFLDCHDGIGLMGAKNILRKKDINMIIQRAKEHGGFISNKTAENGKEEPYEINITWFSALNQEDSDEDITLQVKRLVASRVIALILQGVPGIYLHSLIGTRNDIEAVSETGSKRAINRAIIDYNAITKALTNPLSHISLISHELGKLIKLRAKQRAFHPNGEQKVLFLSSDIFAVLRTSPERDQNILTLTNITNKVCNIGISLSKLGINEIHWQDIVSGKECISENEEIHITMQPYDIIWLVPISEIEKDIGSG